MCTLIFVWMSLFTLHFLEASINWLPTPWLFATFFGVSSLCVQCYLSQVHTKPPCYSLGHVQIAGVLATLCQTASGEPSTAAQQEKHNDYDTDLTIVCDYQINILPRVVTGLPLQYACIFLCSGSFGCKMNLSWFLIQTHPLSAMHFTPHLFPN